MVGLVAVGLKQGVHLVQRLLAAVQGTGWQQYLQYIFPLAGILLTVFFVHKIRKGRLGRGVANIIYSIARRRGNIPPDNTYSHVVTSAVTVGFGGSVGLEAPIVITGSALGSNIARIFLLNQKERIVLLACGAAAGIAAVFNTPVAGVLFAMEVLLAEFAIPTFIPVLIAAAGGAVVSRLLHSDQIFVLSTKAWRLDAIPFYFLLGVMCGLVSAYFMRCYFWVERRFSGHEKKWGKALTGGLLLGLLIWLLPPLFGEGYTSINALLEGNTGVLVNGSIFSGLLPPHIFILVIVLALILLKVFATAFTLGAGGNGGIFAPALFTGALTGFAFAYFFNLTGWKGLITVNFIAAGMAGLLSGVVHAPLTAIFLIAEVTGGYMLFVPLMIVSAISYFISRAFEPYSIYTGKLAQKGIKMDNKETMLLQTLSLADIMVTDFISLKRNHNFRKLAEAFAACDKSLFPVLDNQERLEGLVYIDDVKRLLLQKEQYDKIKISEVMVTPVYKISPADSMETVMRLFDASGLWFLPVVDENKKFTGFADKRKLLDLLRSSLQEHTITVGG